jgi:hypothetical protein
MSGNFPVAGKTSCENKAECATTNPAPPKEGDRDKSIELDPKRSHLEHLSVAESHQSIAIASDKQKTTRLVKMFLMLQALEKL